MLILDEPTAGLDPKQIIETRELIKELAGDHTIILSTHILPEVAQTCQRVVIINKGTRRRDRHAGQPDGAPARIGNDVSCRSTPAAPTPPRRSAASPGVTRVVEAGSARRHGRLRGRQRSGRDVRRDLARAVVSSGWGLLELRPMRMSLEDVFLSLTTDEAPTPARTQPRRRQEKPSMSNILAIAQKELKSYFASPIAYIVIGLWALLYGYFFVGDPALLRPPEHADGPVRHAGARSR